MIKLVKSNLLDMLDEGIVNVIAHGCNCFCTMGAGIALQIKKRYPVVYEKDCLTERGSSSKLGHICIVKVSQDDKYVVNAYTQYEPGAASTRWMAYDSTKKRYSAIENCFKEIKEEVPSEWILGLPRIGCGLAGLDWMKVEDMVLNIFDDREVIICSY